MAAAPKIATSFDDIIQADRLKRKNAKLAEQILGKGRRTSAPGPGGLASRKGTPIPTLASRVGIFKVPTLVEPQRSTSAAPKAPAKALIKSASAANVNGQWTHDLHLAQDRGVAARNSRLAKKTVASSVATRSNINIRGASSPSPGLTIRGVAGGPAAIRADNFAPGTTAEDIRTAMEPLGGEILSCRLLAARPTVMAEILFEERKGAQAIVDGFNGQKADGRVLHVYMKEGPPLGRTGGAQTSLPPPTMPRAQRDLDVDMHDDYDEKSYPGDRDRDRDSRKAEMEVEDGRYGFESDGRRRGAGRENQTGLYSDEMVESRGRRYR